MSTYNIYYFQHSFKSGIVRKNLFPYFTYHHNAVDESWYNFVLLAPTLTPNLTLKSSCIENQIKYFFFFMNLI